MSSSSFVARQPCVALRAAPPASRAPVGRAVPPSRRRAAARPAAALPAAADALAAAAAAAAAAGPALGELAELDAAAAGALALLLKPALSLASLAMIVRIVLTWYPEVDIAAWPWSLVCAPTEPLLAATRKVVKPFNGLDVSPIVWVALLSFVSEVLTGPQGILSMLERKG
jgi:YggT family protein